MLHLSRGFTFTEVLFAIIILGIGFIMLAGMFPIAIQQTQTTLQETAGGTVGPAAVRFLEAAMTRDNTLVTEGAYLPLWGQPNAPAFSNTNSFPPPRPPSATLLPSPFERLRGNQILTQDPRFGWTALYRRLDEFTNIAEVAIFVCQARNPYYALGNFQGVTPFLTQELPHYDSSDVFRFNYGANFFCMANLEPRPVHVVLSYGGAYEQLGPNNPSIVEFYPPPNSFVSPTGTPWPPYGIADVDFRDQLLANGTVRTAGAIAEGCYLVVSDDNTVDNASTYLFERGLRNGSVYRVGTRRKDLDGTNGGASLAYELVPGEDLRSIDENLPPHGNNNFNITYINHNSNRTARAYIVGRGFIKPKPVGTGFNTGADLNFSGPPMDIGVYRAIIQLK